MDLWKKYLLNSIACFAPPERPRVAASLQDDGPENDAFEPDSNGRSDPDEDSRSPVGDDGGDAAGEDDFIDDGTEDDEVDEPELEAAPRRRSGQPASRSERRIETLNAENRRLQDEIRASRERLDALEGRINQPQPPLEDPREEEARLALMAPEERTTYRVEKALRASRNETVQLVTTLREQQDQTAFRQLLRDKPQYKQFADKVEARSRELQRAGTPLAREAILIYLVGEHAYNQTERPRTKAKSRERMASQETRPSQSRGDVRGGDRRQAGNASSAVERRLANVSI